MRDSIVLLDGSLRLAEPGAQLPRAGADHAVQGRPRLRLGGRGIRHRQGAPRPAHDRGGRRTPGLRLGGNKGYGSAEHFAAIAELGATDSIAAPGCGTRSSSLELAPTSPLELVERALGDSA